MKWVVVIGLSVLVIWLLYPSKEDTRWRVLEWFEKNDGWHDVPKLGNALNIGSDQLIVHLKTLEIEGWIIGRINQSVVEYRSATHQDYRNQ